MTGQEVKGKHIFIWINYEKNMNFLKMDKERHSTRKYAATAVEANRLENIVEAVYGSHSRQQQSFSCDLHQ